MFKSNLIINFTQNLLSALLGTEGSCNRNFEAIIYLKWIFRKKAWIMLKKIKRERMHKEYTYSGIFDWLLKWLLWWKPGIVIIERTITGKIQK